jgi:hypothetical protein
LRWARHVGVVVRAMSTTKLLSRTAAVIAAIGFGAYLGIRYEKRMQVTSTPDRAMAQSAEAATLRAENQRLKMEMAPSRPATSKALDSRETTAPAGGPGLDQLRVLASLQKRKLAATTMAYVDRQGKLTPAFVELFALTSVEQQALQQSVDRARDRLAELERENATVTRNEKGEVVIAVKPFPEAGGAAYDALVKSFADTLGADRHAAFLGLGVEQVEKTLCRFGAAQRTTTISQNVAADGKAYYTVLEAHKLPQESGNSNSAFRSFEEMTKHMGTLERLLPPDFVAGR